MEEIKKHWPFPKTTLKRVVVKVGSNVLAREEGGIHEERLEQICHDLADMHQRGIQVLLVSSGAVAAGRGILGLKKRPTSIPELQAVAAIGQGALIEAYARVFRQHEIIIGQVLLNRSDMDDRRRYLNARNALGELLSKNVIPIINENDSTTIDELKFGDNDLLSAMVSAKVEADLLVVLSNIDGLMTDHPSSPDATLVPVVKQVDDGTRQFVKQGGSSLGLGGMETKIQAAAHATSHGVAVVITNGLKPGKLQEVISGDFEGTLFLTQKDRRAGDSRRHWVLSTRAKGTIYIDAGATKALVRQRKSLLSVGIASASGKFERGDVVTIKDPSDQIVAQGVVNYSCEEVGKIIGVKIEEIASILGERADYKEVIHSDNIALVNT